MDEARNTGSLRLKNIMRNDIAIYDLNPINTWIKQKTQSPGQTVVGGIPLPAQLPSLQSSMGIYHLISKQPGINRTHTT